MINLALLGKNIAHSQSNKIYRKLLGKISYKFLDYSKKDLIPSLEDLFDENDLSGLNITSPYKSHFIDQVNVDNFIFKELNSINCIKREKGKFLATNTDYLAMRKALKSFIQKGHCRFVLLGNGAMARVTLHLFKYFNQISKISYSHYHRAKNGPLEGLNLKKELNNQPAIIINACSRNFVFNGDLPSKSCFWDYNYSYPLHQHKFENYIDGYELLTLQARYALDFILKR